VSTGFRQAASIPFIIAHMPGLNGRALAQAAAISGVVV
jgi:hypothetical protein